jgi:hypothetical protein
LLAREASVLSSIQNARSDPLSRREKHFVHEALSIARDGFLHSARRLENRAARASDGASQNDAEGCAATCRRA